MRLVCVTVEEEDVAPPNRACEEDRGGSVEKGAPGAEGVVSDDELALTAMEGDAVGSRRESKSSARGREGDGKRDVCPVDDTGDLCKRYNRIFK